MSRFGPSRGSAERNSSPGAKRSASPVASPKKKAFVSTIKSVETFGSPPPLPPVHGSPDGKWNLDLIVPDILNGVVADPDALSSSHVHLLKRQSVRWLNLSLNLWSLAVLDVYRSVTIESIANFLEMVSWRAHGKVTAEEFSVLYSDWVAKPDKAAGTSSKRVTVGVFGVRQLLLEKKYGEADLDLCIGIIINEINMRLLNSSVSYVSHRKTGAGAGAGHNPFSLEVCTEKWLSLCEELFFTLDTPGYGVLRFDEAFFYCACVTVGMQGWASEEELEADLSLATLTAATLQFLSDTGAHLALRSGHHQQYQQHHELDLAWAAQDPALALAHSVRSAGNGGRRSLAQLQQQHVLSSSGSVSVHGSHGPRNGGASSSKCEVTLAMFKRYFLKRSVGEASLAALLAHVQGCVERVARLARVSGAHELYQACRPYESELGSIGSARLWQQAVLTASGHEYQPPSADFLRSARNADGAAAGSASSGGGTTPPIILFLLSDAERLLSGALRANELPTDGTGFVAPVGAPSASSQSSSQAGLMESPGAANEELHECVYRLWNQFRRWGTDSGGASSSSSGVTGGGSVSVSARPVWSLGAGGGLHHPGSFYGGVPAVSQSELADVQRDPLYQLILTAALQYKALQQLLLAALFDMALTQFGVGGSGATPGAQQVGPLVVICAGLAPNPQAVLVELGFTEEKGSWNDADLENVVVMRNSGTPSKAAPHPLMSSIDSPVSETAPTGTHALSASPLPVPPPRRRRPAPIGVPEADPELDSSGNLFAQTATAAEGEPWAERSPSRFHAHTASSAARKRASQRIQEQRAAADPSSSTAERVAGTAEESSSVEEEVAQAKWSPLFSSQKAVPAAAPRSRASTSASGSGSGNNGSAGQGIPGAKAGRTSEAHVRRSIASSAFAGAAVSSAHTLSGEEAALLSEILSAADAPTQNALIAQMKQLRLSGTKPPAGTATSAATGPSAPQKAPSADVEEATGSGSENGAFGQFQKLEESVLEEHEKRLAGDLGNQEERSFTEQVRARASGAVADGQDKGSNAAHSDAASLGPSSIEELLQQGQGSGQYAQMLREILRKMSRDDSSLQLRSLEQVLQLGHSIAQQDSQERLHEQRLLQGQEHRRGRTPSPRRAGSVPSSSAAAAAPPLPPTGQQGSLNTSFSDPASDHDSYSYSSARHAQGLGHAARHGMVTPAPAASAVSTPRVGPNGAIVRLARVPGLTPDPSAKKVKKVFGHAVK